MDALGHGRPPPRVASGYNSRENVPVLIGITAATHVARSQGGDAPTGAAGDVRCADVPHGRRWQLWRADIGTSAEA